ncbi:MAG TPA: hypothetical protein VG223_15100 [Solirubrobacteraceae bacterium]|nr:hypothetical protein [Solirubrobacteraceae bacterium]
MLKRVMLALFICSIALIGAVAVSAATPSQTTRANQRMAIQVAESMLGALVLPTGATSLSAAPTGASDLLAHPADDFFVAAEVERHAFWTMGASPSAAIASIRAHLPAGARVGTYGSGSSELFDTFVFPTIDATALGPRQLVVAALGLSNGTTVVRADSEVRYVAPRPYSERIPSAARVLDITISGGSPRPVLSRTVTRLSEVRRIAGFVNALPFLGHDSGVAFSCPDFSSGAPVDTFVFRATPAGPVLATVSEWAATPIDTSPCTLTTLRVRGHREPPLMDGGVLLHQAGSLLGVRLARS